MPIRQVILQSHSNLTRYQIEGDMKNATVVPRTDVAVIVGRFQVHNLHEAHRSLIDRVCAMHDRVMVFIGLSPLRNTITNPLDFNTRKRMFQESYPDVEVYYVEDNRSDEVWSKNLDREISKWLKPHQSVTLYGSRDSFISHYHGKFPTIELESTTYVSGTEIRRQIANNYPPTDEFRAGMIAASFNRFPTSYATVDVAIIDSTKKKILLAQKPNETEYRFIGGFADPSDESYEATVRREVTEETGVSIEGVHYIGSAKIDDWRYRGEVDSIKTLFFIAEYTFGRPEAMDDIALVMWADLDDVLTRKVSITKEHQVLVDMLRKHYKIEN